MAPWAGFALAIMALGFLYLISGPWWKGPTMWTAQWTSMALWTRFLLVFLWPLAVGFGALQGIREQRSGMSELLSTTPRPAWSRALRTAGATALTLTAAFACPVLGGAVHVATGEGYAHAGWLPLSLVGAFSLVAGAVLGMGIGRATPSPLTPPLLAVAALGGTLVMQQGQDLTAGSQGVVPTRVALLSPATGPVRDVLVTFASSVQVGQTLWLLGLLSTGFILLVAVHRKAQLMALLPALAAGTIAVAVLPGNLERAYVVDEAVAALRCDGRVCVTRAHESRLSGLAEPGRQALEVMKEGLGSQAPDSVRESTVVLSGATVRERSPATVFVYFGDWSLEHARGDALVRSLVADGIAPTCLAPEDGSRRKVREVAARSIAVAWATGALEPLPGTGWLRDEAMALARPVWTELRALPRTEQRARIDALRRVAISCAGDPLAALAQGRNR